MHNGNQHPTGTPLAGLPMMLITLLLAVSAAAGAAASDAYLGITMSSLTPSMSRALKLDEGIGVLVDRVVIGSPAEQAGLESGDIIIAIDDHTITGNRHLTRLLRESDPGDVLKLTIQREGKQRRLKVTVGERPRRKVDGRGIMLDGAEIWRLFDGDQKDNQISFKEHLTRLTSGYLGVVLDESYPAEAEQQGALVSKVIADSPAEKADIRVGDLIVASEGTTIDSHAGLQRHLEQTKPGDVIELRVLRGGKPYEISVKLAGVAERLGLSELIQRFQTRDPSDSSILPPKPPTPPKPPWPSTRHTPSQQLDEEREELEDLRKGLEELKEQLRKLREELGQRQ